jgi:acyl-homoserine lactone synthase
MIEVITGVWPGESALLDEAMRLRHRVFVEERGWNALRREDGREFDQYDTPATVHHVAVVEGQVAGYVRLNPTTGPHLLADLHSHLCSQPYVREPQCWEWSRYSVARKFRVARTFCDVASSLLLAGLEWGEPLGLSRIVVEFHPVWITRFLELDFRVRPLGLPCEFDGEPTIAVELEWSEDTYRRMCETRGVQAPVLNANIAASAKVA